MSIDAEDQKVHRWAATFNSFAADLLQLHRPVAGSFGYLDCAERCRGGNQGDGDVQPWPCATAVMAISQIRKTHSALEHEAKLLERAKAD